jgi:hypothetical protein
VCALQIVFNSFDTERFRDQLSIYEGDGDGALVAVLHGGALPEPVVVNADTVYVVFKADRASAGHSGFSVCRRIGPARAAVG